MGETTKLHLPLVAGNQAQKHVTVNEALLRVDALMHLALESVEATVPPMAPEDGETWFVPEGATGAWSGHTGRVAMFLNGGWAFLTPDIGWRAHIVDLGTDARFDGSGWTIGAGALSASGAGFVHRSVEIDHAIGAGASSIVPGALPEQAIVYGITGRVLSSVGGATNFRIGVPGYDDRYGSGIGTGAGSWARGITGTPTTYYSDTDLILTAEGGSFDGSGLFRIAVHFAELTLPRA